MTYDGGNPDPGLGKAQKFGRVKPVDRILILEINISSSSLCYRWPLKV
jgi:hypothetical protein